MEEVYQKRDVINREVRSKGSNSINTRNVEGEAWGQMENAEMSGVDVT